MIRSASPHCWFGAFRCFAWLVVFGLSTSSAHALLIGAPTFTIPPTSTMGPIINNTLTVTSLGNGFSVAGQIWVNITTASASGILLEYEVDWPIDPAYPFNPSLFTTTMIDGFSAPPIGAVGNTAGFVDTAIVTLPSTIFAPSASVVPLMLIAGVDTPPWNPPIGANSGTFAFAGAPGMALRQRFQLDGIYQAGPGGTWVIDLPALSFVTATSMPIIPEPASGWLCLSGVVLVRLLRRRPGQDTERR